MRFQMAAEGTSLADITRELNRQAIAACDEQVAKRIANVPSRESQDQAPDATGILGSHLWKLQRKPPLMFSMNKI